MTQNTRNGSLKRAYKHHQASIQAALELRQKVTGSEVVKLRNGIELLIAHTAQGYRVIGLAARELKGVGAE